MPRRTWGAIRKIRTRFYAHYTGPDGAKHTPGASFATRQQAEGWLADERRLIDLKAWTPPATRRIQAETRGITVGQWMETHLDMLTHRADPIRESTAQTYRRTIENRITHPSVTRVQALARMPVSTVTKADIYRWWDEVSMAYPDTPETNSKAYVRLRAAFREAVNRDMIDVNPVDVPAATRKVTKQPPYLPADSELDSIIDGITPRYQLLAILTLHHGLRIGEALAVEAANLREGPDGWEVTVTQNAQRLNRDGTQKMVIQPPKTRAGYRTVPILGVDVPRIKEWLKGGWGGVASVERDGRMANLELVTTAQTGGMVMDTVFRAALAAAVKRVGASPRIKPHSGRRWLITRLAERGAHLKEIGALLGQEDLSTIMDVYMLVRAERTVSLMREVNDSIGG